MPQSSRSAFNEYLEDVRKKQLEKKKSSDGQSENDTADSEQSKDGLSQKRKKGQRSRSFWQLFRAFWGQLKAFHGRIYVALAALTISTILGLIPPLATKIAIDCSLSVPPKPLPWYLPTAWASYSPLNLLIVVALLAIAITLVRTVVFLCGRWAATQSVNRVQANLRTRVFDHVLRMPLNRIYDIKSGGATSLLREDAGGVGELVFSMLYNPWQAVVQLTGSFLVLVLVDWRLLALAVLLLPVVYFSHRTWIQRIRPLYRDIRSQRQYIDSTTTETFGGIRVVRTFARQHSEAQRYTTGNHLLVRQQLMVWWRTRLIEIVWEVLIPLSSTGLLLYGGYQILQDSLTLGDLMMFLVYLTMLLGPIATLTSSAIQFQNNLAGLDRILDILDEPPELADVPNALNIAKSDVRGKFELKQVGFQYPQSENWVLREVDLVIPAGKSVALVGRSGAGKTTLCNLVARFFDPSEGEILLDDANLKDIQLNSFRRLLGIVEQDVFLFDGTIRDNIAYGRQKATLEEVREASRSAAADEFIMDLPKGYDTKIGERGIKLSGGQRQRLAIARAILSDPTLLILDEATSNLDSESEQIIQESLARLLKGRTSIIIAHRLSTIRNADRIVVLDGGRIIEEGTHDELLARGKSYARMVDRQLNPS
jgi:ATP-binding cassette subfamily B protein/subfamily B ATP-binding cassette protein MsbA